MIDRNTPSDPRLRERRGDLLGRSALIFTVALIAAFGAVALLLLDVLPRGAGPGGSPTPTPTPTAAVSGTPSAAPSEAPTSSPSSGVSPTAPATATPTASPTAGSPVPLVVDGVMVGTITAQPPRYREQIKGVLPEGSRRWAVIEVRYQATAELRYDAAHWSVEVEEGGTIEPAGVRPDPPLGRGTLEAGAERSGWIAFEVPARRDIVLIVLTPEEGDPLGFLVP